MPGTEGRNLAYTGTLSAASLSLGKIAKTLLGLFGFQN